jgi:hypothetical protein
MNGSPGEGSVANVGAAPRRVLPAASRAAVASAEPRDRSRVEHNMMHTSIYLAMSNLCLQLSAAFTFNVYSSQMIKKYSLFNRNPFFSGCVNTGFCKFAQL